MQFHYGYTYYTDQLFAFTPYRTENYVPCYFQPTTVEYPNQHVEIDLHLLLEND